MAWVAVVLAFTTFGMAGYVGFPTAPPWLASDLGGSEESNASPRWAGSSSLFLALFLWPVANPRRRAALLGYVVLIALTLVYRSWPLASPPAGGRPDT